MPTTGRHGGRAEGSALDVFQAGQAEEQECLFYVALSRARDRLFFMRPLRNRMAINGRFPRLLIDWVPIQ